MCTYLHQRGSVYYFRRAIPVELRPALDGKAEFMRSLRTKDRATAKRLIPEHTLTTDRLLDDARTQMGRGGPGSAAQRPVQTMTDAEWRAFEHSLEGAEIQHREDVAREDRYDVRTAERKALVERLRTMRSVDLPLTEQAMRDILRERDEQQSRVVGTLAEREQAKLVEALPPAISPAETGTMLDSTIVDLWAAERKVVKKGEDTHRAVARWFYERVGRKAVDRITRKDVLTFKAKLIEEGQSPANVKMKLSRLRTLLQWAADNDYMKENVAAGVTVKDTQAAKNKRAEFDLASLNLIFGTDIYTDGQRPPRGRGEAAYWLPLLGLFTGARLEELGQLRPADVREIAYPDADGTERRSWFIRIAEDKDDDLKLKNAASERDVPVHPELERLGFLKFAKAAAKAKQARLFPRLTPNIYGRLTAKWGEWFGPHLRSIGVTDRRMVFHSFRHTFKQYARHAGIIEGVQRQIMGHSPGDVADEYGSGYPAHVVVAGMAQYRIPGLKLPPAPK